MTRLVSVSLAAAVALALAPQPTVVYFHGGFWAAGSKEGSLMSLIPWMEMGWNVVNVEYRLARVAPAPAARRTDLPCDARQ